MKYTRLFVFAGTVLMSAAINNSAASATAYRGDQANHYGDWTTRTVHAYRAVLTHGYDHRGVQTRRRPRLERYGYANRGVQAYHRGYLTSRAPPAYSRAALLRRAHPYYRLAARHAVRGGSGGGLATFYDPGARAPGFTAAHLSLPMGTRVLVTNLKNRRSVVVRIADRGPEAWTGRVLDLSRVAATSLGMTQAGVVPVTYRVVN